MRSALNFLTFVLFSLTLTNCAMFSSKEEDKPADSDNYPKYDSYSSSDVYKDIKGESRDVSSEDYSDDDYGNVEASVGGNDEIFLGGSEDSGEEVEDNSEPASMASVEADKLPIEKLESVEKPVKKKKVSSKFKNGMYPMSVDCNMRKTASAQSKNEGIVKKGKKLWVEGHNQNWVKVYKKSGAVFINRGCL